MLNNHTYNLLLQITEENKSLWRIKNEYEKDADGCSDCLAFWKMLASHKEKHVEELQKLIKEHI